MAINKGNVTPSPQTLLERVAAWLDTEGYPTEFRTADVFRQHGFHARQGHYVMTESGDLKREVDVLASATVDTDVGFLRFSYVVECKWSLDKPWVIFTSHATKMAPSAMIAQTISSKLGAAVMWAIAGDKDLTALSTFATPNRGGFGGRQAFSKGTDQFYSAVQAVVTNASSYASWYDRAPRKKGLMPEACVIVFPIVVVEGDLFEVYFSEETNKIVIEPTNHVRCHWDGSSAWNFFSTVDVVSLNHLDSFVAKRAEEIETIIKKLRSVIAEIELFRTCGSNDAINVTGGPRGFRGAPSLLAEFALVNADKSPGD